MNYEQNPTSKGNSVVTPYIIVVVEDVGIWSLGVFNAFLFHGPCSRSDWLNRSCSSYSFISFPSNALYSEYYCSKYSDGDVERDWELTLGMKVDSWYLHCGN